MRSVSCSVVFLLMLATVPCLAAEEEQPRTISTTGEAVLYVTPDEVVVNFGVETSHTELEKATALNEKASARLVAAIQELGVDRSNLQTDHLNVTLRYKEDSATSIAGYTTWRGYSVVLKDITKFEKLIQTAINNGANRLTGFQFRTSKLRQHRDQARKKAIEAAREKAVALAGAVGCRIGTPRTVQELQGYSGYSGRGYGFMTQNVMEVLPDGGADGGETTPLGQIGIRANVSTTFDLIPIEQPD